jgi:hypothetical protein
VSDILRGYTFSRAASRYRDTSTGRFVARANVNALMETNVNRAEERLGNIVQSLFDKEISPGMAQTLMRDELRRVSLQNAALGKGGIDRLDFRDYGRVGRQLRDTYARATATLRDVEDGKVSVAQALNRVRGYAGEARLNFFQAQREALAASGKLFEQRRRLNPAEHCRGCIRYASMGWQPVGILPAPGDGSTPCGIYCRCTMETREVTPEMALGREQARRERVTA